MEVFTPPAPWCWRRSSFSVETSYEKSVALAGALDGTFGDCYCAGGVVLARRVSACAILGRRVAPHSSGSGGAALCPGKSVCATRAGTALADGHAGRLAGGALGDF